MGEAQPFLLVRAGGLVGALPLAHVVETMRPLPVEPLAGVPPFVMGVSRIRGLPTPVVNLQHVLAGRAEAEPRRYVTVLAGERLVALATGEVLGVHRLRSATLGGIPPLLREAAAESVAAIGTLDEELLLVLRAARIAPEDAWKALEETPPA